MREKGEIEETAKTLLGVMKPSFIDYRFPEGEIEAKNKEEASLRFIITTWSTPPSLTLYTGLSLGLRCPNALYVYRKSGKESIYRVRLEFYKDDLVFTPFWEVKVEKKRIGKTKVYYCKLVNYGISVRQGESIKPILKL